MPVVIAVLGLAAVIWGFVYAQRGSLLLGCGLLLPVAYVVGHEFWNHKIGPLPITLDRLLLLGLIGVFTVRWSMGRLALRPLTVGDWVLAGMLIVVLGSAITSGSSEVMSGVTSKWGRLVASFIIPATLFFLVRQIELTERDWSRVLCVFTLLGVFLSVTAVLETAGLWAFVFPRYIADPGLGIHFGRARGPELNSVSLGIFLTACFWCAWMLLPQARSRISMLLLALVLPLMVLGVFLTYTRSTWMGLAASGLVVAAIQIPRRWRMPALAAVLFGGLLVVAASWTQILGLEREGSAAESSHSVGQRASFAYVSWQLIRDYPLLGVGYGRFFDRKLPYLSDRTQPFELESIRSLNHHSTVLGLLTETGIVGLMTFLSVVFVWSRSASRLILASGSPRWVRAQGTLMLALFINYLASALFHDLTFLPSQQLLLFFFAGMTINLRQQSLRHAVPSAEGADRRRETRASEAAIHSPRIRLFGMTLNRTTLNEAVSQVLGWCYSPREGACRYIVTPNVDHAVLFQRSPELRTAYSEASLVLADGAPIVFASHLLACPLPERVAGSDLVPLLFSSATEPLRVFLLGAAPGVAEIAAERVNHQWPNVRVVGTYSPPIGFEYDDAENKRILARVASATPDLLIIGLGAPKQELWVHRHYRQLAAKVAICGGATIDFLAGRQRRSPVWMRRVGLEWLHRLSLEPKRLASRYARDAWVFPQLLWREWRQLGT
jgi:N-acetylglucosaminyldiphosphoundecaprenol N-acetyl-beta-D-mannosaminyltransferase